MRMLQIWVTDEEWERMKADTVEELYNKSDTEIVKTCFPYNTAGVLVNKATIEKP